MNSLPQRLGQEATQIARKHYKKIKKRCKKYLGVRSVRKNNKVKLDRCTDGLKASVMRKARAHLRNGISRCERDKECRKAVNRNIDQMTKYIDHKKQLIADVNRKLGES
ncbi:MAG: hypothetical protein ACTSX1_00630 [Candidatus Heimdallarchaeaceae archaeon]